MNIMVVKLEIFNTTSVVMECHYGSTLGEIKKTFLLLSMSIIFFLEVKSAGLVKQVNCLKVIRAT